MPKPDCICLDAEGAVWVADAAHSRLIRVAERGRILQERRTDGTGVFACMLGGDDGRILFACVAPSFREAEASANHNSSIFNDDRPSTPRWVAIEAAMAGTTESRSRAWMNEDKQGLHLRLPPLGFELVAAFVLSAAGSNASCRIRNYTSSTMTCTE
jgi:hypothetical protein